MLKIEHQPLFDSGFKEIGVWELDTYFLEPFGENVRRKLLIEKLKQFLYDFSYLKLDADVWIDGSFATIKEDPGDVDILFWFKMDDVHNLPPDKQVHFDRLFVQRDKIKIRYYLDLYFENTDDFVARQKWTETFGKDTINLNTKGIFVLKLKQSE